MLKVLVCGSRDWTDAETIRGAFRHIRKVNGIRDILIIHGGQGTPVRGADMIADTVARQHGIYCARVDAMWDFYEKKAGPFRNSAMLELNPSIVLAFHDDLANSHGTGDMVDKARRQGIEVRVYTSLAFNESQASRNDS